MEEFDLPYVMVPVPEEHVEEVMQFVLRAITRASILPWDKDSIGELWSEIDESSRSLIAFVARESATGRELDVVDAARKLQVTPRETNAIVAELNNRARDGSRLNLLTGRNVTERLPNGRITEKRVLQIDPEIADIIREVEKADLLETPQPGGMTE